MTCTGRVWIIERQCDARDGRQSRSSRCDTQKLTAEKFHSIHLARAQFKSSP